MRLSPREAETLSAAIRWSATGGRPVCPGCACDAVYDCRRATSAPRWRCKACRKDFSLTQGRRPHHRGRDRRRGPQSHARPGTPELRP
ncbi:hypothetical protein D3877_25485 [Azospirillum cavernae]|uniref:Transposase zinc-ribbon domain-containing protein n=1 Tax=Azospirillum cavernae TaxID=2320860 RepID=A0A418VQI0_9PROT|nr:hypothetical protein D3877_25485 [Azospirillum cavernae]